MQRNLFLHSGDAGDCVASLAVIKAMGGGDLTICYREGASRESMKGARYEALKPLLESQPYIGQVRWSDEPVPVDYDLSTFRHDHKLNEDLATWQARHLNVQASLDPWLMSYRSTIGLGRVVVARSFRYQNMDFPWRRIVAEHKKQILFVGMPDEHKHFQIANGCIVDYHPTKDLKELAEIIAGADLFIGNQSAPFWIAAGLGVRLIQETFPKIQNSIIKRPNAKYLIRQPFDL